MQPQVVHEAEVHRQHIRLKIPIGVDIDGTAFTVDDWSMGGFGIQSEITSRQPGERFAVKLVFPFEEFDVTLRLDCQMVYILEDNTRFGCRFLGLSQGQLALFRYLVDAYLSGEIVSGGDILAVAGRDNAAAIRERGTGFNAYAEEDSWGRRLKRIAGYSLLGLAGLGLVVALVLGIQERFFTVRAETAVIETPVVRLRAPAPGIMAPLILPNLLAPGTPVARIETADGRFVRIESPCDCVLYEWLIQPGQFAEQGEEVALLVAADQPLLVRAQVAFDRATRLTQGDLALIDVPGRPGQMRGQIERIDFRPSLRRADAGFAVESGRRFATVVIRPDQPFEFEDLGSLVAVRFP
jgi:alginate biosynthesis protein Alg44